MQRDTQQDLGRLGVDPNLFRRLVPGDFYRVGQPADYGAPFEQSRGINGDLRFPDGEVIAGRVFPRGRQRRLCRHRRRDVGNRAERNPRHKISIHADDSFPVHMHHDLRAKHRNPLIELIESDVRHPERVGRAPGGSQVAARSGRLARGSRGTFRVVHSNQITMRGEKREGARLRSRRFVGGREDLAAGDSHEVVVPRLS